MRGRIFLSVLLGFSLLALPAFATRYPRERPAREHPGKPDRPGHAMERSRPGDEQAQVTRSQDTARSQSRVQERGRTGSRPGLAIGKPGQNNSNGSSRMVCNEADECHLGAAGVRANVAKAAVSRAPGDGGFGKINNAKGKSFLGKAAASTRTSFNEAGEDQGMSKSAAQAVIFKVAHSRAPGFSSNPDKINNAKGKNLLGRAMPSSRMACNEADECSMGNSGAKAEWQKSEQRSRHH
ncbi:MAG: hypothetical protein HY906_02010 [Deltaproteobacteria bacterium]|nr:hypothetical protein [Deltaproteobacteria bacterium]